MATLRIRVRLNWWGRMYWRLTLTLFGLWLGLRLNEDIIAADLTRAVRIEIVDGNAS
jgi:hypothetical protein